MQTPFFHIAGFVLAASAAAQVPDSVAQGAAAAAVVDASPTAAEPESLATASTRPYAVADSAPPLPVGQRGGREAVLETRVVRSSRLSTGSPRRIIEREEISRAGSLAELLAKEPGVLVQRAGGLGSHARITMRGSPSEQVQILLDGQPLGGSAGSAVDLGPIPLDGLERIEIAQAGSDGATSSPRIELRSRQGWSSRGLSGRAGSFGERALAGWWSDATGRLSVSGWSESADNDYEVPWDNGTKYNKSDDHQVALSNNDYVGRGASLALRPTEAIDVRLRVDDFRRGLDAPGWADADARTAGRAVQGSALWRGPSWAVRSEASTSVRWFRSEWTDPDRQSGWDVDRGSEEDGLDLALAAGLRRESFDWRDFRAGVDLRLERSERTSTGSAAVPVTPSGSRRTVGLEAGWSGRSDDARLGAEATLRGTWANDTRDWTEDLGDVDVGGDIETEWSGLRTAARLWTRPVEAWTMWIGGARSVRPPDFREWMGDNGFTLRTPDLDEETSLSGEAGTGLSIGPLEGGVSAWIARYDHPIEGYQRGGTPLVAHRNAPGYLAQGVDGRVSLDAKTIRLSASGTLQDASIDDPNPAVAGNRPRRLPAWKSTLSVATGPWFRISAGSDLNLQGETFASELNRPTDRRGGRAMLEAWTRATYGRFSSTLALRNLLDEHPEDYEDIPLAGRQWSWRIDVELSKHATKGNPE